MPDPTPSDVPHDRIIRELFSAQVGDKELIAWEDGTLSIDTLDLTRDQGRALYTLLTSPAVKKVLGTDSL